MDKKQKTRYYFKAAAWKTGTAVGGTNFHEITFEKKIVFKKDFANFRRLDLMSNAVCSSLAVLLNQLDLYPSEKKLSMPVFFLNPSGTLYSDEKYWRDFLEFGEKSGRANLFVYTLPTSPLGEASVHFGLTGNLSYITSEKPLKSIAEVIQNSNEEFSEGVLLGIGEVVKSNADAIFIYLVSNQECGVSLENISALEYESLSDLKEKLLKL